MQEELEQEQEQEQEGSSGNNNLPPRPQLGNTGATNKDDPNVNKK